LDEDYRVKLMGRALRDLDGIYKYIAETLLEPGIGLKLVEEIEQEILSLEHFPNRCPIRRTGAYANRGYRQLFVKNYTVIFRVDEAQKTVIVVTVRYTPSQF
jgi:toxin ParE1/3/4